MRRLIALTLSALVMALPASAEPLSLAQISTYLNSLRTVTGDFTQVNPDGTITTGQIAIKRPGRVRFDYAQDDALVMSGGGQVAVFDPVSNEPPQRFPLARTPLSIILADDVDLTRTNMVTGHNSDGQTTSVVAQDPEHPEYGSIELVFSGPPAQLRQWVVTDDSGAQTTVILGDTKEGGTINNIAFNIRAEMRKRGFD
ncbi:Outer membrane lipoprotein-sorting protein [Poseidonocella pacifica]|uniref:Outer membrane lipoprotein-sorting protein n=1 Tax=Poseidonocella pacifica TaxID=871651 RepID=A0A1I0XNI4_9RHOB|nr:outer membrane lipoprotein carrier protein LolA [Poseidonocella pacifica]SFB01738.1 Outer membrane lipoprotein-sorting protein [Poseidonocella pacifica]